MDTHPFSSDKPGWTARILSGVPPTVLVFAIELVCIAAYVFPLTSALVWGASLVRGRRRTVMLGVAD
jgi:hypothetical protein